MNTTPPLTILVGVVLQRIPSTVDELKQLADTAGLEVTHTLLQKREDFHPKFYIGEGKVEELKEIIRDNQITLMVTDDELSPAQNKSLEKELNIKVIDRTGLILDIFAKNAKTYEAKLQVELAQLEYLMPRLTKLWTHLSRLGGGGVGTRGPGEKQLEVDKRQIRHRITHIKEKIEDIAQHRQLLRENREGISMFTAAIVGYTNAGKSTLLNALTQADVLVENKLFATLDPTTRSIILPNKETLLLTDTVGFIQKLPHQLVSSFHATLEETREADFLIHVIDAHDPHVEQQIKTAHEILKEIGADKIPHLYVFNKTDLDCPNLEELSEKYLPNIHISAHNSKGILELLNAIERFRDSLQTEITLTLSYSQMKWVDFLHQNAQVLEMNYVEEGVQCRVKLNAVMAQKILSELSK